MRIARVVAAGALAFASALASPGVGVLVTAPAYALPNRVTELTADVDEPIVGAGEGFTITIHATTNGDAPTAPDVGAPPGVTIVSSSASPSQIVTMVNGVTTVQSGLTARYVASAARMGTYTFKPSVVAGGQRVSPSPVTVRVVAAGQAPARKPQRNPMDPFGAFGMPPGPPGSNPFDLWNDFFGNGGGPQQRIAEPRVATDPALALDAAPGRGLFLHAAVDKPRVVVGEQVTYSVYAYVDPSAQTPDYDDFHESTAADFVKHSLVDENARPKNVGFADVGGQVWQVFLFRRYALFPLRTGELSIGPMSLGLTSRNGPKNRRETDAVTINAVAPPADGRPAGYALGDVGRFTLSANVNPNEVARGDAIAVDVELAGTGNLPSEIAFPAQAGVEALAPEVHDKLGNQGGDRFGGRREFSFVVRMTHEGDVDLGEIVLPFYDPDAHAYDTARATLGKVHVTKGSTPEPDAGKDGPLRDLPEARSTLSGTASRGAPWTARPFFPIAIVAPPFGVLLAAAGARGASRLRAARRARKESPVVAWKKREAEVEAAIAAKDARAVDLATIKALEAAAIAFADVNVRGIGRAAASSELVEAGIDDADARAWLALVGACEEARFSPDEGSLDDARRRWDEARAIVKRAQNG